MSRIPQVGRLALFTTYAPYNETLAAVITRVVLKKDRDLPAAPGALERDFHVYLHVFTDHVIDNPDPTWGRDAPYSADPKPGHWRWPS